MVRKRVRSSKEGPIPHTLVSKPFPLSRQLIPAHICTVSIYSSNPTLISVKLICGLIQPNPINSYFVPGAKRGPLRSTRRQSLAVALGTRSHGKHARLTGNWEAQRHIWALPLTKLVTLANDFMSVGSTSHCCWEESKSLTWVTAPVMILSPLHIPK